MLYVEIPPCQLCPPKDLSLHGHSCFLIFTWEQRQDYLALGNVSVGNVVSPHMKALVSPKGLLVGFALGACCANWCWWSAECSQDTPSWWSKDVAEALASYTMLAIYSLFTLCSLELVVLSSCLSSSHATATGRMWAIQPLKGLAWPGDCFPSPRGLVQTAHSPRTALKFGQIVNYTVWLQTLSGTEVPSA